MIVTQENYPTLIEWLKLSVQEMLTFLPKPLRDQYVITSKSDDCLNSERRKGLEEALSDMRSLAGSIYYEDSERIDIIFKKNGLPTPRLIFGLVDLKRKKLLKLLPIIRSEHDYRFLASILEREANQDLGIELTKHLNEFELHSEREGE